MVGDRRPWSDTEVVIDKGSVLDASTARVGRRLVAEEACPVGDVCSIPTKPVHKIKNWGLGEAVIHQGFVYFGRVRYSRCSIIYV
jgi:hypothetical protein